MLLGMVTAVQTATRESGNVIGNSFKTIFSRIQMDDVQAQLEKLKITVKETGGDLRPVGDIYSDLAQKWGTLNREAKMQTAVLMAGRFHVTRFMALMDNWNIVTDATITSQKSLGSAIEENYKHQKSLESQINRIKSAAQEFAVALGEAGAAGAMGGIMGVSTTYIKGLTEITNAHSSSATSVGALILAMVLLSSEYSKQKMEIITALGMEAKKLTMTEALTVRNLALGASFKSLGLSIKAASLAFITNPIGIFLTLVTAATVAIPYYLGKVKQMREEQEMLNQKYKESNDRFLEIKSNITAGTSTLQNINDLDTQIKKLGELSNKLKELQSQQGGTISIIDLPKEQKDYMAFLGLDTTKLKDTEEALGAINNKIQELSDLQNKGKSVSSEYLDFVIKRYYVLKDAIDSGTLSVDKENEARKSLAIVKAELIGISDEEIKKIIEENGVTEESIKMIKKLMETKQQVALFDAELQYEMTANALNGALVRIQIYQTEVNKLNELKQKREEEYINKLKESGTTWFKKDNSDYDYYIKTNTEELEKEKKAAEEANSELFRLQKILSTKKIPITGTSTGEDSKSTGSTYSGLEKSVEKWESAFTKIEKEYQEMKNLLERKVELGITKGLDVFEEELKLEQDKLTKIFDARSKNQEDLVKWKSELNQLDQVGQPSGTSKRPTILGVSDPSEWLSGDMSRLANVDQELITRLASLAKSKGKMADITSSWRSFEEQSALWEASDKSGKMVAAPGTSKHEKGMAVDVGGWVEQLSDAELAMAGLFRPMDYEPWHIQVKRATEEVDKFGNTIVATGEIGKKRNADYYNSYADISEIIQQITNDIALQEQMENEVVKALAVKKALYDSYTKPIKELQDNIKDVISSAKSMKESFDKAFESAKVEGEINSLTSGLTYKDKYTNAMDIIKFDISQMDKFKSAYQSYVTDYKVNSDKFEKIYGEKLALYKNLANKLNAGETLSKVEQVQWDEVIGKTDDMGEAFKKYAVTADDAAVKTEAFKSAWKTTQLLDAAVTSIENVQQAVQNYKNTLQDMKFNEQFEAQFGKLVEKYKSLYDDIPTNPLELQKYNIEQSIEKEKSKLDELISKLKTLENIKFQADTGELQKALQKVKDSLNSEKSSVSSSTADKTTTLSASKLKSYMSSISNLWTGDNLGYDAFVKKLNEVSSELSTNYSDFSTYTGKIIQQLGLIKQAKEDYANADTDAKRATAHNNAESARSELENIVSGIGDITSTTSASNTELAAAEAKVKALSDALGGINIVSSDWNTIIAQVNSKIAETEGSLGGASSTAADLKNQLEEVNEQLERTSKLKDLFKNIFSFDTLFTESVDEFGNAIYDINAQVVKVLKSSSQVADEVFNKLRDQMSDTLVGLITDQEDMWSQIFGSSGVDTLIGSLDESFSGVSDNWKKTLESMGSDAYEFFAGTDFSKALDSGLAKFSNMGGIFGQLIEASINSVPTIVSGVIERLPVYFDKLNVNLLNSTSSAVITALNNVQRVIANSLNVTMPDITYTPTVSTSNQVENTVYETSIPSNYHYYYSINCANLIANEMAMKDLAQTLFGYWEEMSKNKW